MNFLNRLYAKFQIALNSEKGADTDRICIPVAPDSDRRDPDGQRSRRHRQQHFQQNELRFAVGTFFNRTKTRRFRLRNPDKGGDTVTSRDRILRVAGYAKAHHPSKEAYNELPERTVCKIYDRS